MGVNTQSKSMTWFPLNVSALIFHLCSACPKLLMNVLYEISPSIGKKIPVLERLVSYSQTAAESQYFSSDLKFPPP